MCEFCECFPCLCLTESEMAEEAALLAQEAAERAADLWDSGDTEGWDFLSDDVPF